MNSENPMFFKLIETAKRYAKNAYAPYSQFHVGSAVLTENDEIFGGCNVENASYGATICAERNAITTAVAQGHKRIKAIVIYTPTSSLTPPCGMCLQVMSEFMGKEDSVILSCEGSTKVMRFSELFPSPFEKESLHEK